jgi:hypothetical protein
MDQSALLSEMRAVVDGDLCRAVIEVDFHEMAAMCLYCGDELHPFPRITVGTALRLQPAKLSEHLKDRHDFTVTGWLRIEEERTARTLFVGVNDSPTPSRPPKVWLETSERPL